jgi:hypothetical protein
VKGRQRRPILLLAAAMSAEDSAVNDAIREKFNNNFETDSEQRENGCSIKNTAQE